MDEAVEKFILHPKGNALQKYPQIILEANERTTYPPALRTIPDESRFHAGSSWEY